MLQNKIQEQHQGDVSPTKQHGSPVKGMMNALSKHGEARNSFMKAKSGPKHKSGLFVPTNIEDVPFRRQDRRIINGRKKRTRDRHIIKCALALTLFLILLGGALISLFILYGNSDDPQWWFAGPFLIIGSTLIICGFLFLISTAETCVRLGNAKKRVQDPEIDNISNLHLIKHWIEPEIIPFGWGHNDSSVEVEFDRATLKSGEVHSGNTIEQIDAKPPNTVMFDESNPHLTMAAEMHMQVEMETISKDIFDESLRYSHVDRPSLSIKPSSPLPQRKGSFEDPNEKIANLFNSKGSSSSDR